MRRSSFFGTITSIQGFFVPVFLFFILFEKTNHFCKKELKISVEEVFSFCQVDANLSEECGRPRADFWPGFSLSDFPPSLITAGWRKTNKSPSFTFFAAFCLWTVHIRYHPFEELCHHTNMILNITRGEENWRFVTLWAHLKMNDIFWGRP